MKKILLSAILLLVSMVSFSQSEYTDQLLSQIQNQYEIDGQGNLTHIEIVEVDSTLSKEDLYIRALSYFAYTYGSSQSVIQVQDKERGLIIGKGLYDNVYTGYPFMGTIKNKAWHILTIDIRDGKYKITMTLTNYDSDYYDGNGRFVSTSNLLISTQYPIDPNGKSKTVFGKTFYHLHIRSEESIERLKNAMREGITFKDADKW